MSSKNIARGAVFTRYAPSPTGSLHVGGARTALFNYVFAKKYDGKFILRIEDTDVERNVKDGHVSIEKDLKFLEIFPDESFSTPGSRGPYLQSQKLDRYRELCNQLITEGKAYRCFCGKEELEEQQKNAIKNNAGQVYSQKCRHLSPEEIKENLDQKKPYSVRLKVDIRDKYEWQDILRKDVHSTPSYLMGDFVIMRPSNIPTYNFAVVVDDYDMGINYVLRGDEHISNTAPQLAVYYALGWENSIPNYAHLSLIVGKDGKKLSKRSGDEYSFVSELAVKGYPSAAVFNFLALLGWSFGEKEIFSIEEIIANFDITKLSTSSAYFDVEKLNWLSHKYFSNMSDGFYWNFVQPFFDIDLGQYNDKKYIFALFNKENIHCASELNELAKDFYTVEELDSKKVEFLAQHESLIKIAIDYFPEENEEWNQVTIKNYLKQISSVSDLSGKDFFKPLRLAFSHKFQGLEISKVLECLGRDTVFKNLKFTFSKIQK